MISLESSPAPHFESMSVHDYWKNHAFHYADLCQQSDVSAFEYDVWVCHSFSFKEEVSFSFMAAVTVHSDFGAQGNTVCHSFRISPSMHVLLVCLSLQCVVFADLKSWQPISSCLMVCVYVYVCVNSTLG